MSAYHPRILYQARPWRLESILDCAKKRVGSVKQVATWGNEVAFVPAISRSKPEKEGRGDTPGKQSRIHDSNEYCSTWRMLPFSQSFLLMFEDKQAKMGFNVPVEGLRRENRR